LGAQQRDVLRLIMGQGIDAVFFGVVVAALELTRLMSSLLFWGAADGRSNVFERDCFVVSSSAGG
jgi:hypothetical protein